MTVVNSVGTNGAIAGTDSSDPSTPKAPLLFGSDKKKIIKRVKNRLRENLDAGIQNTP